MAYRDLGQVKTFIAEGDLSAVANQYTFVKVGTAGNQVVLAGAGEAAVGVQWGRAVAGEAVAVVVDANAEPHVIASEAIALGDEISSNAAGIAAVSTSTDVILATATSAAATGGYVTIKLLADAKSVKA
tara:strand:- start:40 stop:426 length:387 start_codon:yes stop_codon:yes gene_type:complete